MDVILFGAPRAWQNEMDRQGFDPMEKTPGEVIAFMENIEATEDRPDPSKKSNSTTKKEAKKPKKSGNANGGKTKYYCTEHGENWTHDTKDCRTLQNKAKGNNNNNNGRFQNKTWNRKSEEAKKEATKELATLIAKQVKKQLAAADKKRKTDDDSDSDEDCALLQGLTGALDGFNYEQMENLSIDDDEVSC